MFITPGSRRGAGLPDFFPIRESIMTVIADHAPDSGPDRLQGFLTVPEGSFIFTPEDKIDIHADIGSVTKSR